MCIIIDTSAVSKMRVQGEFRANPVLKRLQNREFKLAIGGKLTEELLGTRLRNLLVEMVKSKIACDYKSSVINIETQKVKDLNLCKSNDAHVIALARISGVRILYADDGDLHADFKNTELVPKPRGRIYQDEGHRHLLNKCPPCKNPGEVEMA